MFNKKLVLVAIFFVSLIAVSAVSASDNMTEDIVAVGMDSSNDEILTVADGGTFKDLQDKIDAADEGGTIILENNYTNNGTFSKDGINITKSITIEGNGVIIDASNYSRIFNIDASKNVILNNITFTGGNASTGGAIIFNNDISDCVISNCEFLLNNAIEDGGAIYFNAIRNVTIKNTLFSNNIAGKNGGAIYVNDISDENLFENVTFSNNKALEWDGGAINFVWGSNNTKFKNSKFLANIAYHNGGAINSDDDFVNNSFYNVEFVENTAVNSGGAFSVLTLSDGNIFANVNFTSNQAVKSSGGAINFIDLTSNNIFNNTGFYSNHAGGDGGAISSVIKGNFVNNAFYNTQFANNNATEGGALYVYWDVENNLFNGTTFTGNEALNGGAIYANGNILNTTIADSEFKDNTAIVGTNNIGLNRENPDFILINVTPEYLGPYYVGYLSILNVTDNITYGETVEIILNVFGVNHFPLNNGTVSVIVNNQTYTANVENGNAILKLSDVVPGKYDVNVTYTDNDYLASAPVKFNVSMANSNVTIEPVATVFYGNNVTVYYNVENRTEVKVLIVNKTKLITTNYKLFEDHVDIYNLAAGNYSVIIVNMADDKYKASWNHTNFTIEKAPSSVKIMPIDDVVYPNDVFVDFQVLNATTVRVVAVRDDGTVVFDQSGDIYQPEFSDTLKLWGLDAGNYQVIILNAETENYTFSGYQMGFAVEKAYPYMETSITPEIKAGDEGVVIQVVLPEDATGRVMLSIDGEVVSQMGYVLINGTANISVPYDFLTAGRHSYLVSYDGDDNYESDIVYKSFNVAAQDSEISVDCPVTVNVGEDVNITVRVANASGTVELYLNDNLVDSGDLDENSTHTFVVSGLAAGEYYFTVIYTGDENHEKAFTNCPITVEKAGSAVKIMSIEDVVYPNNAFIHFTILNATTVRVVAVRDDGTVVFDQSSDVYQPEVSLTLELWGLRAGSYMVAILNAETDKVISSQNQMGFAVLKQDPIMETSITEDIMLYDNNVTIDVTLPKTATGRVMLLIDGEIVSPMGYRLINGAVTIAVPSDLLTPGRHSYVVSYDGDINYLNTVYYATFEVSDKYSSTCIILPVDYTFYPGEATINYIVYNATEVTIQVLTDEYAVIFNKTTVAEDVDFYDNITLAGLAAGEYYVVVLNMGNDTVAASSDYVNFIVDKAEAYMKTSITPEIKAGDEGVVIQVVLPENATGRVMLSIDGEVVSQMGYVLINGTANIGVPYDFLTVGGHSYLVSYDGDDNYESAIGYHTFNVAAQDSEISVDCPVTANVGDDINMTVRVANASGTVVLYLDDNFIDAGILDENSTLTFVVRDLVAGDHYFTVVYAGDENHEKAFMNYPITVEKAGSAVRISPIDDVVYPDDVFINFQVLNATTVRVVAVRDDGTVVFDQSGDVYQSEVNLTLKLWGLRPASYMVGILNAETDNVTSSQSQISFAVLKQESIMETSITEDIRIHDENVTINVTLPKSATGRVMLSIDGEMVSQMGYILINGSANITVPYDFLTAGRHVYLVSYDGDDNYEGTFDYATFDVKGKDSSEIYIFILDDGIYPGEMNFEYVIFNATEVSIIVIKEDLSIVYKEHIVVNEPVWDSYINLTNLAAGDYIVSINNMENENFTRSSEHARFIVYKAEPNVETTITSDIKPYDENVTIEVVLPEDATGRVMLAIDGEMVSQMGYVLINGTANIAVPYDFLTAGRHVYFVSYDGDDNYAGAVSYSIFNVDAVPSEVNITTPVDFKVGEEANITVDIPGATGDICVIVDGIEKVVPLDENGSAVVPINVTPGEHSIVVVYTGDETHSPAVKTATFAAVVVPTKFDNVTVENDLNITAILIDSMGDGVANATITYTIGNVTNSIITGVNGEFTVPGVAGETITIDYAGDDVMLPTSITITLPELVESYFNITGGVITLNGYAVDTKAGEEGMTYATELLDSEGKPISGVKIQFAVNDKIYGRTTDEKGSFTPYKLNMVRAGRYTMAFYFGGNENYISAFGSVCVDLDKKPIAISASAKTYKASATKSYTVTLSTEPCSSSDGKAHLSSGKKVTLLVNGKTYTGKTDSNGKVTFKLTNLSKKGVYTAKIGFDGDNTYEGATKSVKITIK